MRSSVGDLLALEITAREVELTIVLRKLVRGNASPSVAAVERIDRAFQAAKV
jgi:hypothetical protein